MDMSPGARNKAKSCWAGAWGHAAFGPWACVPCSYPLCLNIYVSRAIKRQYMTCNRNYNIHVAFAFAFAFAKYGSIRYPTYEICRSIYYIANLICHLLSYLIHIDVQAPSFDFSEVSLGAWAAIFVRY